jgi:hypothetical protein
MLHKKPGIAPPIGGGSLSRDLRERVSAEERRFLPSLSLRAIFGGHTSRVADGPRDWRNVMMYIELRIRCSQPLSLVSGLVSKQLDSGLGLCRAGRSCPDMHVEAFVLIRPEQGDL